MANGRIIEKKCWPEFFELALKGKNAEIRLADFDVEPGDTIRLREWKPLNVAVKPESLKALYDGYTGRILDRVVAKRYKVDVASFWSKDEIAEKGLLLIEFEADADKRYSALKSKFRKAAAVMLGERDRLIGENAVLTVRFSIISRVVAKYCKACRDEMGCDERCILHDMPVAPSALDVKQFLWTLSKAELQELIKAAVLIADPLSQELIKEAAEE